MIKMKMNYDKYNKTYIAVMGKLNQMKAEMLKRDGFGYRSYALDDPIFCVIIGYFESPEIPDFDFTNFTQMFAQLKQSHYMIKKTLQEKPFLSLMNTFKPLSECNQSVNPTSEYLRLIRSLCRPRYRLDDATHWNNINYYPNSDADWEDIHINYIERNFGAHGFDLNLLRYTQEDLDQFGDSFKPIAEKIIQYTKSRSDLDRILNWNKKRFINVKCGKCNDIITKPREGWYTECNCKQIAVDFDRYELGHNRFIGDYILLFNWKTDQWDDLKDLRYTRELSGRKVLVYPNDFNWKDYGE